MREKETLCERRGYLQLAVILRAGDEPRQLVLDVAQPGRHLLRHQGQVVRHRVDGGLGGGDVFSQAGHEDVEMSVLSLVPRQEAVLV